jgi:hypothetical protein
VHGAGGFDAGADGEGDELCDGDTALTNNDETGNNTESELGSDEPDPIYAFTEERIDEIEHTVQETGPKNGSNNTAEKNGVARDHGEHGAVKKADKNGCDEMDGGSNEKAIKMKRFQRAWDKHHGLGVHSSGEQVNRIPDTSLLDDAVETGKHGHGDGARESTLDASRDGVRLERKKRARKFRSNLEASNNRARGSDRSGFVGEGDFNVLFVRKNIEEPADTPYNEKNRSQDQNGETGDEAGKKQRDAKGESDGPSGGSGQLDHSR